MAVERKTNLRKQEMKKGKYDSVNRKSQKRVCPEEKSGRQGCLLLTEKVKD